MANHDGAFVGGESGGEWIESDVTAADFGVEDDAAEWTETEAKNINPADDIA